MAQNEQNNTLRLNVTSTDPEKQQLTTELLTSKIANMWTNIGDLQVFIKELRANFDKANRVADILQELLDSYLVCVGQLELHLHENNYLDGTPDEDTEDIEAAGQQAIEAGEEDKGSALEPPEIDTSEEADVDDNIIVDFPELDQD